MSFKCQIAQNISKALKKVLYPENINSSNFENFKTLQIIYLKLH